MKKINIKIFNQLKDNYSFILESKKSPYVSIIDPAESKIHIDYLKKNNLSLENIFLTHHHDDHVAGVSDLLSIFPNTKVYSPSKLIKSTTDEIKNGMQVKTKINSFHIIETPGHTLDHIILHDKENDIVFCGDTLFRFGCGRVFEGTLDQMYDSLQKINKLPDKTILFCGHEYTINNIKFLESILVNSENLLKARNNVNDEIHKNGRSIPFNLGEEKKLNPFLNQSSSLAKKLKTSLELSDKELFVFLRQKKDIF
tara:strand:- start:381 stop:1145 length:765 start_codon:yes stop_codon:yes gene_type:complete